MNGAIFLHGLKREGVINPKQLKKKEKEA